MERRRLGRTDLKVSAIGFGCGLVGGLMVGASQAEQEAVVAMALDAGLNYFDTAPFYGNGQSESNLGHALRQLNREAVIGTKVRIDPALLNEPESDKRVAEAVEASLNESLRRLRRDHVDLLQLHNAVSSENGRSGLAAAAIRNIVFPAFERLIRVGKVRQSGLTGLGHAASVIKLATEGLFDTVQVAYSLLNPSAQVALPADSVAENYGGMLTSIAQTDLGVIGIRVLSGGSLSGTTQRHPVSLSNVIPLGRGPGSGTDYDRDATIAQSFDFLVSEGIADSLASAALRYGMSNRRIHTMAVGFSSQEHLAEALRAVSAGMFDTVTLERIANAQRTFGLVASV